MLEIYGRKNSSNVIPVMWTVGELGLEHQRHNIGGSFGGDDTEEYARLNPNRLIPTIRDDGFVLWESMAITRCARWASNWENVPSPAPRSAMTCGGMSLRRISARPFQDLPGQ